MDSRLINPFGLLGVTSKSTIYDLKKAYYQLSLMCHPDKGGDSADMVVISKAYQYVKQQLDKVKDTTYEELEDEFQEFCKNQELETPPTFAAIYEETQDWLVEFNRKFNEEQCKDHCKNYKSDGMIMDYFNEYKVNPFKDGYADIMDKSEYNNLDTTSNSFETDLNKLRESELKPISQKFNREITEYKEPESLPNTVTAYPLENKEIVDYSGSTGILKNGLKLEMTDYKKAYSPNEELPEVKPEIDYPKEKMEYKPFEF
jgi:curved DNA-binding protein CbpA